MCLTHWRVVFELWCADMSDSLCSWSGKLCAPDSFSRSSSVTLRPHPHHKGRVRRRLSPATRVPRPLCQCVKVPRLSSYTHARLAFSHTVRPCCIFVPTQRLLGSHVQSLTAAPHHDPSGVQPYAGGVSHGFQARLVSSWTSSITAERPLPSQPLETCHPCDVREDQAKDSPTKKKAVSPGPHRELLPAEPLATQAPQPAEEPLDRHHLSFIRHMHPQMGIHQRNALWGFLCDVPRTTLTSSG